MTIEISLLISGLAVAVSLYFGTKNSKRNDKQDTKTDAAEMTTVIVELKNISKDTTEIKNDMKDVKQDVKSNTESIIRIDESLKSAWKRIEIIEGKKQNERKD